MQPSQSRDADLLLDHESFKMEYKAPNLEVFLLMLLSNMEALNKRAS
jgi:hypothetical protein